MRVFLILLVAFLTSLTGVAQEGELLNDIQLEEPTHMDPVSIGAIVLNEEATDKRTVVLRVKIMDGYHIYAYVSPKEPYIKSEVSLELPEGATTIGKWDTPVPSPYPGKPDLLIYNGDMTFKQELTLNETLEKDATCVVKLFYQCCDANICFPPKTKEVVLKLN